MEMDTLAAALGRDANGEGAREGPEVPNVDCGIGLATCAAAKYGEI
jgi:hypothetical protein